MTNPDLPAPRSSAPLRPHPPAAGHAPPSALALSAALALLALHPADVAAQSVVPFTPGMRVTESVRVAPGTYEVGAPASLDQALIVVDGDGVTLDLTGVRLVGLPPEADPDGAAGVAVRVDGGTDVTIRGGALRGYRFAVLARGTRDLHVLDADLSYNWKPRLFSQVGHESLVDWLSYHDNEDGQWMRFGAAIYLDGVRGGSIAGNRAVQGMNGLLMTDTDSVRVQDNDFSYNSGLGIGLYRSSHNRIVRNRLDYDVRGYSEGLYQRGQDSAGLLVYAQSSHNLVAYNSATHSGDGFFLWAGQRTMDTGEGGANDNLLFYNDFSYAPTNAVEVTFSRNRVLGNFLRGSRYGVWGGYSWESEIRGNCFGWNQYGVAIEHGQDNVISGNRFDGDSLAVSLWSRESEPSDWGYARYRDTYSRDHAVEDNLFAATAETWRLERTRDHRIGVNRTLAAVPDEPCDPRALLGDDFDRLVAAVPEVEPQIPTSERARLPRSAIVVDGWGPHDGLSPKLWPADSTTAEVPLRVLGPPGRWRVVADRGVASLSAGAGEVGDTVVVVPAPGSTGDWSVTLEYVGEATVSPRGTERGAGEAVAFGFERFDPIGPWRLDFFLEPLFEGEPFMRRAEPRLDYQWYTPRITELPREGWALEGTASLELDEGEYSLRAISDGAIRVWVDDRLVIDRWEPHGAQVDYAPLGPGAHELRVRYSQPSGWTEVRVDVIRGRSRSEGSPGPH